MFRRELWQYWRMHRCFMYRQPVAAFVSWHKLFYRSLKFLLKRKIENFTRRIRREITEIVMIMRCIFIFSSSFLNDFKADSFANFQACTFEYRLSWYSISCSKYFRQNQFDDVKFLWIIVLKSSWKMKIYSFFFSCKKRKIVFQKKDLFILNSDITPIKFKFVFTSIQNLED